MNRVFRVGRRRRQLALVMGIIAAVIMGLALPASAHNATITGQTECVDGVQVITWTITNSSSGTDLPMTIVSTNVGIDGDDTPYTMVGYTTPVAQGASTTGTTTVPGGVTGTISATVHVSWPDDVTDSDYEAIDLTGNCVETTTTTTVPETTTTTVPETTTTTVPETTTTTVPETTTTTVPETTTTTVPETTTTTVPETTTTTVPETTTTTVPETTTTTVPETTTTTVPETTTTTVPETTTTEVGGTTTIFTTTTTAPETTTTLGGQGSTVPTVVDQATTTTAAPSPGELPRTGSSSGFAVFFALSCLAGGALLLIRRRHWAE